MGAPTLRLRLSMLGLIKPDVRRWAERFMDGFMARP
jgi:hypothetical protein